MVYRKSEYGRQFRSSIYEKNLPTYKSHVAYRYNRREREHAHTPFLWDDSDTSSEYTNSECGENPQSLIVETSHCSLENKDEAMSTSSVHSDHDDGSVYSKGSADNRTENKDNVLIKKTPDQKALSKAATNKLMKYVSHENQNQPQKALPGKDTKKDSTKIISMKSKPKRPDRHHKIPKSRPKSAPCPPLPVKECAEKTERKQIFMSFGLANTENGTGVQRTHNVRSPVDVYPAALRAMRRKEFDVKRHDEEQKKATQRDKRRKTVFDEKMSRETAYWMSEYQYNYPQYDREVYSRCLSARAIRKSFDY